MKKLGFCFLVLILFLVGCKTNSPTPEKPTDEEKPVEPADKEKPEEPTDKEKPEIKGYPLGAYGDYVTYVDETKDTTTLEEDYLSLTEKKKETANGVFQSNYCLGLLKFFSIDEKIKLSIDISKEELKKLDEDYKTGNKESYRICNLDIELGDLLFHYEQVGIRQKGNTSRGAILDNKENINLRHYKLNFTATFDDEFTKTPISWTDDAAYEYRDNRNFFGLEKLNIRWNRNQESTYLREYYAFEMYRQNGVLAPHSAPMQVEMKIDGDIQNLGIYLGVEDVDKSFIKRNLVKDSAGGDLYKMGWTNVGATLDDLNSSLFGVEYQIKENQGFKQIGYTYDLKTNKKTSKHELIKSFIQKIIDTPTNQFDAFLKSDMIYDYTIKYLAISYLLGDPDDLRGNSNNTYLYFLKDTNQAIFIPTDHDRALGSTGGTGNPTNHHGALNQPFDDTTGYAKNTTAFFNKSILESGNVTIKEDYLEAISSILSKKWLDTETFEAYYNKAKKNYSTALALGKKVNGSKVEFSLKETDSLSDGWNLSIDMYFQKKKESFTSFTWDKEEVVAYSNYYLRGEMNGWDGIEKKYNLKFENGVPTITIHLEENQKFKVADSSWSSEFNYEDLVDKTLFNSVGGNKNIAAKSSGIYKIEIIDYGTDHQKLFITKQ
ncbi:MAG: CotH kinase family protein [Anaeroplasmataceae bacterium]|nr:CotH kinase family protein [Anaeroplasmataceae bacterium]MDE6415311.1 CotH kinase family protein [Anaeroplasmataceae bacterium]